MGKIITVTANTAIDLCLEVDGLCSADNLPASNVQEYPCGKGVNVARGLVSLGRRAICLGLVGSQSAPAFDALGGDLLQADFCRVAGKTRTNITLYDIGQCKETHIRTPGFSVDAGDCAGLRDKLESWLEAGDVVVLSGSLPPGAPANWYARAIDLCRAKGAAAILDSSGEALAEGLASRPYLVKPNQHELEQIAGRPLSNADAIVGAARDLVERGIEWVYVSRGADGVIAVGRDAVLTADAVSPPCPIATHIGCGDAMVAGLAVATLDGKSPEQCLRKAVACGSANLCNHEPGRFDGVLQRQLMAMISLRTS